MNKVSLQVPASLSDFSVVQDGRTTAKLKMFYVGETADGRVFTEDFANQLVKSLPYCPVVGFFSDIQEDFLGHNSKQYIYGFVKPDAEYGFEEGEDGKKWLVTEVMLYTDRPDNTGEVARKIVGQPQSLELNPNNVKYEVFKEEGKRKIKFTEGSLIGLSVLGTKQKPAFTGSEFFMESDVDDMRERFDSFFSFLEDNSRGEQMDNKEQLESYVSFVKLSYNDKMERANAALQEQLGDNFLCYIEDMNDNDFVAGEFSFETGRISFAKYDYACTDAEFEINNRRAAFKKFLTVDELNYLESFGSQAPEEEEEKEEEETKATEIEQPAEDCATEAADQTADEDEEKEKSEDPEKEDEEDMAQKEDEKEEEEVANAQSEEKEEENKEEADGASKEDENDKEFSQHTSTLSDSEREELEKYRQQEKERLIVSYEGMLSKEVLESFANKINDYEYEDLEAKLAIAFSKYSRENKEIQKEIPLSFGNLRTPEEGESDDYASLVKRVLKK